MKITTPEGFSLFGEPLYNPRTYPDPEIPHGLIPHPDPRGHGERVPGSGPSHLRDGPRPHEEGGSQGREGSSAGRLAQRAAAQEPGAPHAL